jgi:CMP-N,N'-diacetyllegionaminic acid synthase
MHPNIAIIPARAKSKEIPDKNIKLFHDHPLIYWTIKAALESEIFQEVLVSTDSSSIAELAIKYGASIPEIRPGSLSTDESTILDVTLDLLEKHCRSASEQTIVTLLQPTSPLRTPHDIRKANELMKQPATNAVVSVSVSPIHPQYLKKINPDGNLAFLDPQQTKVQRRQEMDPVYFDNGSIYMINKATLLETKSWFPPLTKPLIIPSSRSIDIDDHDDFNSAEKAFKRLKLFA